MGCSHWIWKDVAVGDPLLQLCLERKPNPFDPFLTETIQLAEVNATFTVAAEIRGTINLVNSLSLSLTQGCQPGFGVSCTMFSFLVRLTRG